MSQNELDERLWAVEQQRATDEWRAMQRPVQASKLLGESPPAADPHPAPEEKRRLFAAGFSTTGFSDARAARLAAEVKWLRATLAQIIVQATYTEEPGLSLRAVAGLAQAGLRGPEEES